MERRFSNGWYVPYSAARDAMHAFYGSNWASYAAADLVTCAPADSFTAITFDNAMVVRSNLGHQGGRCRDVTWDGVFSSWTAACDEPQSVGMAPEVLIRDIGRGPGNVRIDLRITNETEYKAWNERLNGVKRVATQNSEGYFGVISQSLTHRGSAPRTHH